MFWENLISQFISFYANENEIKYLPLSGFTYAQCTCYTGVCITELILCDVSIRDWANLKQELLHQKEHSKIVVFRYFLSIFSR